MQNNPAFMFCAVTVAVVEQMPFKIPPVTKIITEMASTKSNDRVLPITEETLPYFLRQFDLIERQKELLAANSNHIEGSRLTHDQTRYIYETNTIGIGDGVVNVDDVVETANHFRCIDMVIDNANYAISESFIKMLHFTLKNGTSDSRKDWFAVGDYKKLPNEVGGHASTLPEEVAIKMRQLIASYNSTKEKTLEEIIDFHYRFERIHPFQDGNGRVGRLILFKECLRNNIVPFIINDELKMFYYQGLNEWEKSRERLLQTCLLAQDDFKEWLKYYRIPYEK